MLKAIIIEDERPAMEMLLHTLAEAEAEVRIEAVLSSVAESIHYLSTKPKADIIFSDVQLSDGLSFEIFKTVEVSIPVIFITAHDEFIINAFDSNGIDYLLKPVNKKEIKKSLLKYRMFEQHFINNNYVINKIAGNLGSPKKRRLIVRKGLEYIPLKPDDIVLFYTENKIVYLIDRQGKKYQADKNLSELEEELDKKNFFRANRQYLLNIKFVRGYKSYETVKLLVDLDVMIPDLDHQIIVSQETAPQFRQWMFNA